MSDTPQVLLAHHLKTLKLPTFLRECQRRSKNRPLWRSKTRPPWLMRGEVLRVVPVVHRRDPRCFV